MKLDKFPTTLAEARAQNIARLEDRLRNEEHLRLQAIAAGDSDGIRIANRNIQWLTAALTAEKGRQS